MLIYLWIRQSPAQTDAIIRESSAILLFFGVVETKKFRDFSNGPHCFDSVGFPNCGFGGLSSPPIPSGDWNVARTHRLENLRYIWVPIGTT